MHTNVSYFQGRGGQSTLGPPWTPPRQARSISEISSCFFGPRPWHIEIRHRVKKTTSTINVFGFETLKLKIRRLKLWKPTAWAHLPNTHNIEFIPSLVFDVGFRRWFLNGFRCGKQCFNGFRRWLFMVCGCYKTAALKLKIRRLKLWKPTVILLT